MVRHQRWEVFFHCFREGSFPQQQIRQIEGCKVSNRHRRPYDVIRSTSLQEVFQICQMSAAISLLEALRQDVRLQKVFFLRICKRVLIDELQVGRSHILHTQQETVDESSVVVVGAIQLGFSCEMSGDGIHLGDEEALVFQDGGLAVRGFRGPGFGLHLLEVDRNFFILSGRVGENETDGLSATTNWEIVELHDRS